MTLEETIIRYHGSDSVAAHHARFVLVAMDMGMLAADGVRLVATNDGYRHCSPMGRLLLVLHECGPELAEVA